METMKQPGTFGERLRALRKEKGYTLQGLAERVGCSHQALQKAETGVSGLREPLIRALAMELRVSSEWLKTGEGSREEIQEADAEAERLAASIFRDAPDGIRFRLCRALVGMTDEQVATLARLCEYVVKVEAETKKDPEA